MRIPELTINEASKKLHSGEVTSVELTRACIDAIRERDGDIHALLEVYDDALSQAEAADARIKEGNATPLTGIPIIVKDNILVQGKKASAASKILENYTATYDATVIKKLKEAGVVFVGRANMDEFAMGSSTEQSAFGPTRNPHDTTRVPGGSSGGSAASVAAGFALGALGSDTAGSIRFPAALCGVVGFKPTYGAVSRSGLIALGSSLDCIGPLTKSVTDAEMLFDVISGKDAKDSTTVDATDYPQVSPDVKTVGVPRAFIEKCDMDARVKQNFYDSLARLEQLDYTLADIELPNIHYGVPAYYVLLPAEASANLARFDGMRFGARTQGEDLLGDYIASRGQGFGPEPRRRILIGTYVLSAGYYDAYYNRAHVIRTLIKKDFEDAFSRVDVIAMPTSAGPAFKLGEKTHDPVKMYLEDVFTVPANHAGIPAISVPSGTVMEDGKKLPLGLQFMAPHLGEGRLFSIGKKFLGE
ncbi:MAG: glutamyl-tRNA(Gln) amidotransferase subunit A [Candidatus Campbellbacteria bacterium]